MNYKTIKEIEVNFSSNELELRKCSILINEYGHYFLQLKLTNISQNVINSFKIIYRDKDGGQIRTYDNLEIVPEEKFFSNTLIPLPDDEFNFVEINSIITSPCSKENEEKSQKIVNDRHKPYSTKLYSYTACAFLVLSMIITLLITNGIFDELVMFPNIIMYFCSLEILGQGMFKMSLYNQNKHTFEYFSNKKDYLISLGICIGLSSLSLLIVDLILRFSY